MRCWRTPVTSSGTTQVGGGKRVRGWGGEGVQSRPGAQSHVHRPRVASSDPVRASKLASTQQGFPKPITISQMMDELCLLWEAFYFKVHWGKI